MRYILSILCLCLASGALTAQQFTVKQGQLTSGFTVKVGTLPAAEKEAKSSPSSGSHKCMVCEGSGCGCGCRSGGTSCSCHPGWRPSSGNWWFYRQGGVEIGAYDKSMGTYWQKYTDGWREWIDPPQAPSKKEEVRLDPRFFRSSSKC